MEFRDKEGRYIGLPITTPQRKCDKCGREWQSGWVRFERCKSVESLCQRCAPNA